MLRYAARLQKFLSLLQSILGGGFRKPTGSTVAVQIDTHDPQRLRLSIESFQTTHKTKPWTFSDSKLRRYHRHEIYQILH